MEEKLSSNSIEFLKWTAIFFMVIDHVGKVFFDNNIYLNALGRIAFPLFAFILAHNYIFFTKNKVKYIYRLFVFAIISQPIYYYVFHFKALNILFTLSFGLITIYLYEILKEKLKEKEFYISFGIVNLVIIVLSFLVDYAMFGIYLVVFFYFSIKKNSPIYDFLTKITMFLANIGNLIIAPYAFFSLYFIEESKKIKYNIKRTNKWFFYLFYPAHLAILIIIKDFVL